MIKITKGVSGGSIRGLEFVLISGCLSKKILELKIKEVIGALSISNMRS
jgi:hypothetical protein